MKKLLLLSIICSFCALSINAQEELPQSRKAWEFGVGGSVYQFNRVPYIKFTPGEDVNIVDIKLRHAVYTGNLYAARELSDVFALDMQGGLGKIENEWLTHLSLGLQWRFAHYLKSPYIDPYIRVGAGYMYKGYDISYSGEQDDVKYQWWNVKNKDGRDANHAIPVSAGVGVNMWLNDRFGIGLSGDYLYIPMNQVANPLQGTVRLLFRLGGKAKRPQPVVTYVEKPVERIVERLVEVEKIVEKEVSAESAANINEMLRSIYFDFDSYTVKAEYLGIIRNIAAILLKDTGKRYLLTGFTDAKGSSGYNKKLSGQRVNAIMDSLKDAGVPGYMLKAKGVGNKISHAPVTTSDNVREGDRKVTIELITNTGYWEQL